ncbi:MAG: hypothetical protein QM704_20620 [Anaeromyxobacteraceae bacterium]
MTRALLAVALLLAGGTARAASFTFVHAGTVYTDAKEGPLVAPEGVACTDDGRFVVADTGNARLLTFTARDGRLGGGTELKLPQLTVPLRLQLDSKGNLFALDGKTHRIVKMDANGGFGGVVEFPGVEGARVGAFKIGPADEVLALELTTGKVLVLGAGGTVARSLELPKGKAMFTDVAMDASGTIYALDAVGGVLYSAEKSAAALKPLAQGLQERMSFGTYLAVVQGKLLVVDQNGSGVVALGPDGGFLGRQLGLGWSEGLVNYPGQLCANAEGVLFLADRYNNRVQLFRIVQ